MYADEMKYIERQIETQHRGEFIEVLVFLLGTLLIFVVMILCYVCSENAERAEHKTIHTLTHVKNEHDNVKFQKDSIDYIKQYHRDEYDMCAKKVDITASDGVFAEQMRTCVKRLQ